MWPNPPSPRSVSLIFSTDSKDALSYLEELYHDTLAASYDGRIYARSPLAEDGFLSSADYEREELRRISLSRGYSPEEKASLSAPLLEAQAVRSRSVNKGGGSV